MRCVERLCRARINAGGARLGKKAGHRVLPASVIRLAAG